MRINNSIIDSDYDLSELIRNRGFNCPGVVIDAELYRSSQVVVELVEQLKQKFDVFVVEYQEPFEPTYQYLDRLMSLHEVGTKIATLDVWIGIGGGSTIDTAKGLAILSRNEGRAIRYRGFPDRLNTPLPVIAIASTAGSGSDVSFNASFIDEATKTKMGINYSENYPILTILDPRIVSTAPFSVVAASGVDALVHTLESFVSRNATPVSRFFSIKAFHLIAQNFPMVLSGEANQATWKKMQWAAIFAMWGLSNSTSGPAGALSYYLGTHYLVRHGIAGGVFIGKITRLNYEHGYHNYADLFGWSDDHDLGMTKRDKSEIVVQTVEGLLQEGEIPASLKAFGIGQGDKKGFVDFAQEAKGAFDLNPVQFSNKDLDRILL